MSAQSSQPPKPVSPGGKPVLSPHLQIWRFTITMAASITHRACGVALYSGSLVLAVWLYATAFNPGLYGVISDFLKSSFGIIFLGAYVWALFFHLLNGLRHIFWDQGHGFELSTAVKTAWGTYIGATILMLIVMVTGLTVAGGA